MHSRLRMTAVIIALAGLAGCMTPPPDETWPSSAQAYQMPPLGVSGASYGECWRCAGFYHRWD